MPFGSLALLVCANCFMTFAWYFHLERFANKPLWFVILFSWGLAFFEYCFQVPANRIGSHTLSLGQLKVAQEVITMVVFIAFATFYLKKPLTRDLCYATLCLIAAAYFMFRGGGLPEHPVDPPPGAGDGARPAGPGSQRTAGPAHAGAPSAVTRAAT